MCMCVYVCLCVRGLAVQWPDDLWVDGVSEPAGSGPDAREPSARHNPLLSLAEESSLSEMQPVMVALKLRCIQTVHVPTAA